MRKLTSYFITLLLPCMIIYAGVQAQTYTFKNPVLVSGTALQAGAIYKFPNVASGLDARVTISAISPGMGLSNFDDTTGYKEAFQPTVTAAAWTTGYVEMTIDFVNTNTITKVVQPEVSATCVDVDGSKNFDGQNNNLYEYDELNLGGGFVDFNKVGGELSITQTGNWISGSNITGNDYSGRDTANQQVMFTVGNTNISSLIIRFGIKNQTTKSSSRNRSAYFKKVAYNNSMLSVKEDERLRRVVNNRGSNTEFFNVYPTVVQHSATINVKARRNSRVYFEMINLHGVAVYRHELTVKTGDNVFRIDDLGNLRHGAYIAIVKIDGTIYNHRIIRN